MFCLRKLPLVAVVLAPLAPLNVSSAQESPSGGGVAPVPYSCSARDAASRRYRLSAAPRDEFEGYTKTKTPQFELQHVNQGLGAVIASFGNAQMFRVELQHFVARDSTASNQVFVTYDGKEWFFIRDGESLVFLADTARIGLTGDGSARDRDTGGTFGVSERAMYEISDDAIRAIAQAKAVKVRIYGSRGYSDHVLTKVGSCTFARFASELLDRTP